MHLLSCFKADGRRGVDHPHSFLSPEPNVLTLTKKFFDEYDPKESINDTHKEVLKKKL